MNKSLGFYAMVAKSQKAKATLRMHVIHAAVLIGACSSFVRGNPIDLQDLGLRAEPRADLNLVGYLGAFFLGADPYVYFYQSNGNDPVSFKALNKGQPVLRPTKGTGGVRDPAIVQGGGNEAGRKWYIVGTDLNIGKVSWCQCDRFWTAY
jgi:hypothetical protein